MEDQYKLTSKDAQEIGRLMASVEKSMQIIAACLLAIAGIELAALFSGVVL